MISVVLPAFRERENLPGLVRHYDSIAQVSEIIVVDDASQDGTREILAREETRARLVYRENTRRIGLAPSVLQGIRAARAPWILVRDSDWNHRVEDITFFLEAARRGDSLIVASRYAEGKLPLARFNDLFSLGINLLLRLLWRGPSDWTYGYFMANRERLLSIPSPDAVFRGRGEYTLRLYRSLLRAGVHCEEFLTRVAPRGSGKSSTRWWKHGPSYLATILELRHPVDRYEKWAQKYGSATRASGHGRLGLRARRRLIRRVPLPRSGHVLDVGCGNGAFASLWKSLSESTAALSGVDASPSALNVASSEFGYRETFLANWHSPAGDAQTYDGILGLEVLQYMPRHLLADFLRRWGERLEPDGALYILYPDRGHPLHRVRRALLGPRHEDYCLPHGLDDLHEAIREAGFRAARQESTGFFLDRGRFCHLLRLEIATGSRDERREKDRPSREAHDPLG